jgi:hypothetical protein
MQSVIEHLRSHAPANAVFYRLVGRSAAGEYTLYPRDGNAFYKVGEAPRGLLPGLYQVFFFEAAGRQIQTARVELSLSEAAASALGPTEGAAPQLGLAAGSPSPRSLATSPAQLSLPLSSAQSASASASATLTRDQAEHRMRMERDQQQHNFIHNSAYAREVGETLMLQRMMRQEMVEMQQLALRNEQEGWDQIEKRLAALRMMREAQKEVLADLNQIPAPPTPKPDWTPLIFSTIQTVQAIGMALVDKFVAPPRPHEAPAAPAKPEPAAASEKSAPAAPQPASERSMTPQATGPSAGGDSGALPQRSERE